MEEGLEAGLEDGGKWMLRRNHGILHMEMIMREGGKLRAQHTAVGSRHEVTGCGGKFHT